MTKFRHWIISKLFNTDEKYMIIRALEDRISNLELMSVRDRWIDKNNVWTDIKYYKSIKQIFSTKYWG